MTPAAQQGRHHVTDRRQRHRSAHRPPGPLRGPHRPAGLRSVEVPVSRYGPLPKWWSPEHFLEVALPLALQVRPRCLEGVGGGGVAPATFLIWARHEAGAANRDGTQVIVSADNIAEAAGMSVRTVKRCRAVARRLGVYRTLLRGRPMTHLERVAQGRGRYVPGAWPRRLANESTFLMPKWLSVALSQADQRRTRRQRPAPRRARRFRHLASPGQTRSTGDNGTPPSGWRPPAPHSPGRSVVSHREGRFATEAAPPPALTWGVDPATVRVARELVSRHSPIPWLRGTSARRLTFALVRYVEAGWTVSDVRRWFAQLEPRRWDRRSVQAPAGLCAWFLRRADPWSDRPGFVDELEAARRREQQQQARLDAAAERAAAAPPTGEYLAARQQLAHRLDEQQPE